jgi:hypothetical protein
VQGGRVAGSSSRALRAIKMKRSVAKLQTVFVLDEVFLAELWSTGARVFYVKHMNISGDRQVLLH